MEQPLPSVVETNEHRQVTRGASLDGKGPLLSATDSSTDSSDGAEGLAHRLRREDDDPLLERQRGTSRNPAVIRCIAKSTQFGLAWRR